MPHGQPDFWTASYISMPTLGSGQITWFQSEGADVDGLGSKDLINYVVPDGYEFHVCSGIVSCNFPCLQRYQLRTTPAATWVPPISHSDLGSEWDDEEKAYDGDIATYTRRGGVAEAWTDYLILLVNQASIDKIKFYATDIGEIDVDVFYEGDWHDVYEGVYADREWVEKDIPAGVKPVSKARVRFYNSDYLLTGEVKTAVLYEFMFNTSGVTPQEGVYFDTHSIIPYLPQAPYIVPAGATFVVRMYNDDADAHYMSVALTGFLQAKV